jgi:hypothetical protein
MRCPHATRKHLTPSPFSALRRSRLIWGNLLITACHLHGGMRRRLHALGGRLRSSRQFRRTQPERLARACDGGDERSKDGLELADRAGNPCPARLRRARVGVLVQRERRRDIEGDGLGQDLPPSGDSPAGRRLLRASASRAALRMRVPPNMRVRGDSPISASQALRSRQERRYRSSS